MTLLSISYNQDICTPVWAKAEISDLRSSDVPILALGGVGEDSLHKNKIGCKAGILLKIGRIFYFSASHGT